jgi:hypothetical protein
MAMISPFIYFITMADDFDKFMDLVNSLQEQFDVVSEQLEILQKDIDDGKLFK